METPSSSTRRVTRSQTMASLASTNSTISRKMEDTSEKGFSKSKQRNSKQDRSVLIDITNDSPIVGLASGNMKTPVSSIAKQKNSYCKKTPGSGEALLRGQVKTLLQKVEEEAEISKFSLPSNDGRFRHNLKAFLNSPAGVLAPTPANTPLVINFSAVDEVESFGSVVKSPVEDPFDISQVVNGISDEKKHDESSAESEKDLISRTLFLDFSEKSDSSSECSSVVTCQGKPTPSEDDDASIWSIQVNASIRDEDEDEDEMIEDDIDDDADNGNVYDDDDGQVEDDNDHDDDGWLNLVELCEGMSKVSVNGETKFMGKHTRFVYDSDDELIQGRHNDEVLRLKGLPTPKGKHFRFQDDEEEE